MEDHNEYMNGGVKTLPDGEISFYVNVDQTSVAQLKYAVVFAVLFILLSHPTTYATTSGLFGRPGMSSTGLDGLLIHGAIFGIMVYVIFQFNLI